MSKRRLTDQQRTRIQQQQSESTDLQGLVLANFGRQAEVRMLDSGDIQQFKVRANIQTLVAGDNVRVSSEGSISALLPRRTELLRPDPQGRLKPVAANIDSVFVVVAPEPQAFANLIDRYLVAIAVSDMKPVLVLNKIDLLGQRDSALINMLGRYEALGIPLLRVSGTSGEGLSELASAFEQTTGVLVGQSGVGKSSLVNALHPEAVTAVGALSSSQEATDVSREGAKGTHTTTTARLFELPTGGALIDSPGIREFHLWHIEPDKVLRGFPDLEDITQTCKFRNCAHQGEKGCAVKPAREKSPAIEQRWQSYARIIESLQTNTHK
ncbi:MAG: ribosome small subunit-dependent GTPase A [Pseudomonadales bacterium]